MEEAHDNSRQVRRETIHNQHRRSYWHDYYQKGLYIHQLNDYVREICEAIEMRILNYSNLKFSSDN